MGGTHPEIVLVNSHDGTSSYQLSAGLFRLVCSNGLILSEGPQTVHRVPHTGDARAAVIDGCIDILQSAPQSLEAVREFSALMLTDAEQSAFARAAYVLRYPDAGENERPHLDPERLLQPQRREDWGNDLWTTLNRVQENTVQGGQAYTTTNAAGQRRRATSREVKGIDGNVTLNRALWTLAEEMRKLKG